MEARQDFQFVVLLDHQAGAGLVGLHVLGRPPVLQVALGIILATLVVEAVGHFMADHHADGAVVHRVVRQGIEERRLQDAGGEDDLVHQGVVVGVDGGRRH